MARQGWMWAGIGVSVLSIGVVSAVVHARRVPVAKEAPLRPAEAAPVRIAPPSVSAPEIVRVAATPLPPPTPPTETHALPAEAAAKEPTAEEVQRQAVLGNAGKLGACIKRMAGLKKEGDQAEQMAVIADLMKTVADLGKFDVTGPLAADALTAAFDGMMPADLAASEDQKTRFQALYLDLERHREMFSLPQRSPFAMQIGNPRAGQDPLTPEQRAQEAQLDQEIGEGARALLTPQQRSHLESMRGTPGLSIGMPPAP